MLFAGVRPSEVNAREKPPLLWRHLDFKAKTIRIEAATAKTRVARVLEDLPPNLWQWLKLDRSEPGEPVCPLQTRFLSRWLMGREGGASKKIEFRLSFYPSLRICVLMPEEELIVMVLVAGFIAAFFVVPYLLSVKDEKSRAIESAKRRIDEANRSIDEARQIRTEAELAKDKTINEARACKHRLAENVNIVESLMGDGKLLSGMYADYKTLEFKWAADHNLNKKRPAWKRAENIKAYRDEARKAIECMRELEYRWEALLAVFPDIEP